jgi:hypothetical protein
MPGNLWGSEQFPSLFPLPHRESYLQFTSQVNQSHIQLDGADFRLTMGELWWIGWMPEKHGKETHSCGGLAKVL